MSNRLKVTFLGTGTSSGVPLLCCTCAVCQSTDWKDKRLRSSIFIEYKSKKILIDIGSDFRQQMLRENIQKIDAVLLTHAHNDHTASIDEIRAYNFATGKDIDFYADELTEKDVKNRFQYIFQPKKYPGVASINMQQITDKKFGIGEIEIQPIKVMHHKLPVTAFRIENFAYVTDIKTIAEGEKKKLFNLDVLILGVLQKKEHISHLNLNEAMLLIEELKPKKVYFTHISHLFGLHKNIQAELPPNISIAYDGLKIEV